MVVGNCVLCEKKTLNTFELHEDVYLYVCDTCETRNTLLLEIYYQTGEMKITENYCCFCYSTDKLVIFTAPLGKADKIGCTTMCNTCANNIDDDSAIRSKKCPSCQTNFSVTLEHSNNNYGIKLLCPFCAIQFAYNTEEIDVADRYIDYTCVTCEKFKVLDICQGKAGLCSCSKHTVVYKDMHAIYYVNTLARERGKTSATEYKVKIYDNKNQQLKEFKMISSTIRSALLKELIKFYTRMT